MIQNSDGSYSPEEDEILCHGNSEIVKYEDCVKCEACRGRFCPKCIKDWKETGKQVCDTCVEKIPVWIDEQIDGFLRVIEDQYVTINRLRE